MDTLTGRRALVTGGGGAIGRVALGTLLDLDVDEVVVTGRRREPLDEVERLAPGRVRGHQMDVAEDAAWTRLLTEVQSDGRGIDVLVACAGVARRAPYLEGRLEDWEEMWRTNVLGTLLAARHLVPGMSERGWGRIVLISSAAAHIGLPGRAVYGATKAAIEALARSLAAEFGGCGILVNTIAPGMYLTSMTEDFLEANPATAAAIRDRIPVHRFGQVGELAEAFRLLVTTTYMQGASLRVDGGWTAT
jgi:NAD(P)-dependent dehydrogenase (short-subunit alcohol dehydrogenase family)